MKKENIRRANRLVYHNECLQAMIGKKCTQIKLKTDAGPMHLSPSKNSSQFTRVLSDKRFNVLCVVSEAYYESIQDIIREQIIENDEEIEKL